LKRIFSLEVERLLRKKRQKLITSILDMLILSALREKPMSGYDVILMIRRRFRILVATGGLYYTLCTLERQGLVKGNWIGRRRVYVLTPKGEYASEAACIMCKRIERLLSLPVAFDSQY